jgi:cell division protein FtsB
LKGHGFSRAAEGSDEVSEMLNKVREFGQWLVQWRRMLASALLIALAIVLASHVLLGSNGWMAYRQKKAEYEKLQQELKSIDEENRRLDAEIRALRSDPKAIEKEAREHLRYARQGEVIYLMPEQQTGPVQQPPKDETAKK